MSDSTVILPFAKEDSSRKTHFSENIEYAALLCMAEAERKKAGLFGKTEETLTTISKLHHPFWAIPREDGFLLIDGMKTVSGSILYFEPPNVEAFVENLKQNTTAEESYRTALRNHSGTFSGFISQSEIPVEGFVTTEELLSDILCFVKDGSDVNTPNPRSASFLQPEIGREKAVEIGGKVLSHHNKLWSEIKGLQFAVDSVNEETKKHVEKLRQALEQMHEIHKDRLAIVKAEVEKKKEELENERDWKIEDITKNYEKEVNTRLEMKRKHERELLKLEQNKSEYKKRRELRKQKNDKIGKARWDAKLKDVNNQVFTLKAKIKTISDYIDKSSEETEKTVKNLNETYKKFIDEEETKITDLENLCKTEIEECTKEIEMLQQETLAITEKIEQLIEQKQERSSILKRAVVPWKIEAPTLIYVPFYLIQYEANKEKRWFIYPPIIARGHEGLMVKIRKALKGYSLQSKISTLLKPRCSVLEKIFASLQAKSKNDETLQKNLAQLGIENNLLVSPDFKQKALKGMGELEAEGWIKPEEKSLILNTYLTSSANVKNGES
ncbi:MAG: hypothetical protein ACLFU9_05345 [Candidatus Bathyarchaeia archaeon]